VTEATALAGQRSDELTALGKRHESLAGEHRLLRRSNSELESKVSRLDQAEDKLAAAEQRLRLLEVGWECDDWVVSSGCVAGWCMTDGVDRSRRKWGVEQVFFNFQERSVFLFAAIVGKGT
jgi:hypothetical protein